jgi:hypothetical protein
LVQNGVQTKGGGWVSELTDAEYRQLVTRVRDAANAVLPPGATVLVVSKGDDELLELYGRRGYHFPQDEKGAWLGYNPADSSAAIAHLEELAEKGAEYLLFPRTTLWWLDHYGGLASHLSENCPVVASGNDCAIFKLSASPVGGRRRRSGPALEEQLAEPLVAIADSLLPDGAGVALLTLGEGLTAFAEDCGWQVVTAQPLAEGDGASLVGQVQQGGAEFLIVARTAFEWMDQYPELRRHLRASSRFVTRQEHVCELYELS